MRPNNRGIMPTVELATNESVLIKLQFPENRPGDRIHVELVDGGYFTDSEKPGRILTLAENRTAEVTISSDDRPGHLKLYVRQSGHTRVLPFWTGPRLPLATNDDF